MHLSYISAFLAISPTSLAYGGVGHRTIGYLAEKWLTPKAAQVFGELLANDRGFDFSDAAVWADIVRDQDKLTWDTSHWHYVNNLQDNPPKNVCGISWNDCPEKGCVLSAIINQTNIVKNPDLDPILRKNATMFIIHFLGDLHQPLHTVGFQVGGTQTKPVCWDTPHEPCSGGVNLHAVWDRHIAHKQRGLDINLHQPVNVSEKAGAAPWAAELYQKQIKAGLKAEECLGAAPEDKILEWAKEVNVHACQAVYKPGLTWLKKNDLSEKYFEDNKQLVEDLIAKAGLRLGCWLNTLADSLKPESQHVEF